MSKVLIKNPSIGSGSWYRFRNIQEENRLYDLGEIETGSHFLLYCPSCENLRKSKKSRIFWSTDEEKMEWLFNFCVFKVAKFESNAWKRRQDVLFV